jgi:hypothetical protein
MTNTLDMFFTQLKALSEAYVMWTSEAPKTLVINPDIVMQLSKVAGFYQRPELTAQVTAHSPIVRHFKLDFGVVLIREDWEEKFYHFE